jgi:hypothetical protein
MELTGRKFFIISINFKNKIKDIKRKGTTNRQDFKSHIDDFK